MLAGDEFFDDDVTSGVLPADPVVWCADCGTKLTPDDGDLGLCRDCSRELGEAGA